MEVSLGDVVWQSNDNKEGGANNCYFEGYFADKYVQGRKHLQALSALFLQR